MSEAVQCFYVDQFLLTLNPCCYLVEIRDWTESIPRTDKVSDIPEWALNSKHAIWLKIEDKPILERAKDGELIRKRIRAVLHRHSV